ncbi:uncharacterized protein LOC135057149 [Pseudophryne corroboree]|uniref:uncharacterized protein LOC134928715 n=1 Tax=Pseudophryne corroboree TaxID=495146 RepID=UPI0030820F8C
MICRYKRLTTDHLQPQDCRQLLEVAKSDFMNCIKKADICERLSAKDKVCILHYLEALLILKHLQRPGVVANMTVEEWHERVHHTFTSEGVSEIRVVVGVKQHKTATHQVATFALTEEEEKWFKTFFDVVRPLLVKGDQPQKTFFISTKGEQIYNVTNDLRQLHEKYKLLNITSQMVRRTCETWTLAEYSDVQKSLFTKYLAHTNLTADRHYREKTLHNICLGSKLVTQLGSMSKPMEAQESTSRDGLQDSDSIESHKRNYFQNLLKEFPVNIKQSRPKKVDCKRISPLYWHHCRKEWTAKRNKKRVKHIIRAFPARRPKTVQLKKYIREKKWKCSELEIKQIAEAWKPRKLQNWKDCKALEEHIRLQNWKGLKTTTDIESGIKKVMTERAFLKGEAICDFHGEQISAKKGRKMQENKNCHDLFFYKDTEGKSWCINPSCTCHTRTYSKLMWKSSTEFNVIPIYKNTFGILMLAAKNIPANQELTYYVAK